MSIRSTMSRKRLLYLTERAEWEEAAEAVDENPDLAKDTDDFGMTPLHWACTDPSIPIEAFRTIVEAHPHACECENMSGMLPIHVAITSSLPGLHIHSLLKTAPDTIYRTDQHGLHALELATEKGMPKHTMDVLRQAQSCARIPPPAPPSSTSSEGVSRVASYDDMRRFAEEQDKEMGKSRSLDTLMNSHEVNEYSRAIEDKLQHMDSKEISGQLKDLLTQLQQLSTDIRSSSSSVSTYRSSVSSNSSSGGTGQVNTVLWHPTDRLGLSLSPADDDTVKGAYIKSLTGDSSALGVEALSEGDLLVSINGTPVSGTPYKTIVRFLKHSKGTCKLKFAKDVGETTSVTSHNSTSEDPDVYHKVTQLLNTTLRRVQVVEESMRLNHATSAFYG